MRNFAAKKGTENGVTNKKDIGSRQVFEVFLRWEIVQHIYVVI